MYGKGLGTVNAATGISLLPSTGDNHLLFALAAGLLVSGLVILTVSIVMGRKGTQTN